MEFAHNPPLRMASERTASSGSVSPFAVLPLVALGYSGYFKGAHLFRASPVDITLVCVLATLVVVFVVALNGYRCDPRAIPLVIGLWGTFSIGVMLDIGSGHSWEKAAYLFSVTLLCALAPCYLLEGADARRMLLWLSVFFAALMGVFAALWPDLIAQGSFGRFNLDGATTIGTARVFGGGTVVAGMFALTTPRWRWWWGGVAAVFMALTVSVGSRGPVISVLLALSIALLLAKTNAKRRVWAIVQLSIAIALMSYSVIVAPSAASNRVLLFLAGDNVDPAREYLYREALRQIATHPLGVGWGGFRVGHSFNKVHAGESAYPHNIFLEVAVESGWVAALCLLALTAVSFRRLVLGSATPESAAMLGLGIYWLSVAQTSSDVNGNRLTWIVLVLGILDRGASSSSRDEAVAHQRRTSAFS